jgi:hypothetical protein
MNITGALYTLLQANVGVTNLVGNKIYPLIVPQTQPRPAVTIQVAAVAPSDTKSNTSGVDMVQVQFSVFAQKYSEAAEITEAIRKAIDKVMVTVAVAGKLYRIGGVRYLDQIEQVEEQTDTFHIASDYLVRYHRGIQGGISQVQGILIGSITATQPNTQFTIPSGRMLEHIIITGNTSNIKVGTTVNGNEVADIAHSGSQPSITTVNLYSQYGQDIYFTNVAVGNTILLYLN